MFLVFSCFNSSFMDENIRSSANIWKGWSHSPFLMYWQVIDCWELWAKVVTPLCCKPNPCCIRYKPKDRFEICVSVPFEGFLKFFFLNILKKINKLCCCLPVMTLCIITQVKTHLKYSRILVLLDKHYSLDLRLIKVIQLVRCSWY